MCAVACRIRRRACECAQLRAAFTADDFACVLIHMRCVLGGFYRMSLRAARVNRPDKIQRGRFELNIVPCCGRAKKRWSALACNRISKMCEKMQWS